MATLQKLDKEDKAILAQFPDYKDGITEWKDIDTDITQAGKTNVYVVINRLVFYGYLMWNYNSTLVRKCSQKEIIENLQNKK